MDMKRYLIPASETRAEIIVKNSRFIATIKPVFSVDQAKEFIAQIKIKYSDASHNVPAFVVGHGASVITHCNDDGEPSGTAGRPTLAVLQGSGLGDAGVVVTRYFGGTKLGTGGLVRAYSDAVNLVIDGSEVLEYKKELYLEIEIEYANVRLIEYECNTFNIKIIEKIFDSRIVYKIKSDELNMKKFLEKVSDFLSELTEILKMLL